MCSVSISSIGAYTRSLAGLLKKRKRVSNVTGTLSGSLRFATVAFTRAHPVSLWAAWCENRRGRWRLRPIALVASLTNGARCSILESLGLERRRGAGQALQHHAWTVSRWGGVPRLPTVAGCIRQRRRVHSFELIQSATVFRWSSLGAPRRRSLQSILPGTRTMTIFFSSRPQELF